MQLRTRLLFMAKSSAEKALLSVVKRTRRLLEKRCGAKVQILHVEAAHRGTTGEPVYRVHAALEAVPNALKWTLVVDTDGKPLEPRELEEEVGRDVFDRADVGIVRRKLRPAQADVEPGIVPEQNFLTLRQGEAVKETVTVTVPRVPALEKLDVYFLADVTGSMMPVLTTLQNSSNAILGSIRTTGGDVAFGVGSYRDFPGPPDAVFMAQQAVTTNDADVTAAIASWSATGGGDTPEGQLFALDRIANDAGGEIGWRDGARHVVVWFGDAPGHEPVCTALTGQPPITTVSVAGKLRDAGILVIAISAATTFGPGLDANPQAGATDYGACGPPGGFPAQATTIADETGGVHLAGIDTTAIVDAIIAAVGASTAMIGEVRLDPVGPSRRFVAGISPPEYGPLPAGEDHRLEFTLDFVGDVACGPNAQVFEGQVALMVDGVPIASKRLQVTVPACADEPPPPPPPPVPPGLTYELDSAPSAVSIQPGRASSGAWEISVLATDSNGGLVRLFNIGDPEDPTNWGVETRPRPGGPAGTRVSGPPLALRTTRPQTDPSNDFVHALVRGTDADLHEIVRGTAAWTSWADHDDPRTAVVETPSAIGARRRFYYEDDAYLSDSEDQVFAFVWGDDGRLWRFYRGWHPHGFPAPGVTVGGPPAALYPLDPSGFRAYAFVVGNDRTLYANRSVDPEMSTWTWHLLGRPAPTTGVYFLRRPAVVAFSEPGAQGLPRYAANIFLPAEDRALWTCRWEGPPPRGVGTPPSWTNLGRPGPAVSIRGSAAALVHDDGTTRRVYAFVHGSDGNLWVNVRAAGDAAGAWTNVGKPVGADLRGDPAAVTATPPGSDPLYAFLRGSDDRLHLCHMSATATRPTWVAIQ